MGTRVVAVGHLDVGPADVAGDKLFVLSVLSRGRSLEQNVTSIAGNTNHLFFDALEAVMAAVVVAALVRIAAAVVPFENRALLLADCTADLLFVLVPIASRGA